MDSDDFETKTTIFLSWLSQMGISMSTKAALVDMRAAGRGRGVGEFLSRKGISRLFNLISTCVFEHYLLLFHAY